jgi:hypothetical protein
MDWRQVYLMLQFFVLQRQASVRVGEPEFLLYNATRITPLLEKMPRLVVSSSPSDPNAWLVRNADGRGGEQAAVSDLGELRRTLEKAWERDMRDAGDFENWSPVYIPHLRNFTPGPRTEFSRRKLNRFEGG